MALALGHNMLPVKESKGVFRSLCKEAFTKRLLADVPGVRHFVRSSHHGLYKTSNLKKALMKVFADKPIFGGGQDIENPNHLRVAVTSTSSSGYPYLLANYNRAQSKGEPSHKLFSRPC